MKELLKKLINARSTSQYGELKAANVLADYFSAAGIVSSVDVWWQNRANIAAQIKSSRTKPALLFVCHLDVVPAGEQLWKHKPFEAVEQDGRIYGRGSADMKGGITAVSAAFSDIARSGVKLKGDLILVATAGEEVDSCGLRRFLQKSGRELPELAGIIIPEPTNFELITAHRGMLWLEIVTKGKTAHGSMPQLGINAIDSMTAFLNRLTDYEISAGIHPLLGQNSMSVNRITGGTATNVVPDKCSLHLDIRTLPGRNHERILNDFEKIFKELKRDDSNFAAEVSVLRDIEALLTDSEADFVKRLKQILGIDGVKAVPFTTDGPIVAELGRPVVIFGPGQGQLCHKPDEYIEIRDVEKAAGLYKKIILEFLG